MVFLYILHSSSLNRFYTGSCKEFSSRYADHIEQVNPKAFTGTAKDWKIFLVVENLQYKQARNMELHIKRMKSAKYIFNLKKYPEIIEKLRLQYQM